MGSLRGVWGLRPQLGVPPLHPFLSLVAVAIAIVAEDIAALTLNTALSS